MTIVSVFVLGAALSKLLILGNPLSQYLKKTRVVKLPRGKRRIRVRYPTPISRIISTVFVSNSDFIVTSSKELLLAVLYLESLNSVNPVDLIIK
jgi:hypothetical protein